MPQTVIYDPFAVTAGFVEEVLREAGALTGEAHVSSVEHEIVGTGQVGANVRYRLAYDGDPGDAPRSVVCKFASLDETSRAGAVATGTYQTEVSFYQDVAPTVEISRPTCYLASIRPGTADVILFMEDLAPAEQGDQLQGCTVEQAGLAVVEAARLHGPRWDDPTLTSIPLFAAGGDMSGAEGIFQVFWGNFLERYRDRLKPESLEVGAQLAKAIPHWGGRPAEHLTITHFDYRLDNMLFATPSGGRPITVVDWQTVRLGRGTSDVAYFLSAAFADPDVRRRHERQLVEQYHGTLLGYGVEGYDLDQCWEDYRRFAYSGFLMAVMASNLVGQTDRGDEMFMAMANRAAVQVTDLDSYSLL